MSYDYSSETKQLELPNPYKVQNSLMWIEALLLCVGGLIGLWWGRQAWAASHAAAGLVPIAVGLGLLVAGIWAGGTAATRLRFFFGRKRPVSLAPELTPGVVGTSDAARGLEDLLRQGALEYPEPSGPVEGVLYNLVPHLITAPIRVQELARKHFFNLAALVATLLSFVVAWLLSSGDSARAWVSLAYFVFGFLFLLRPVASQARAQLSVNALVGLIAGAILGPVIIGWLARDLPPLARLSLAPQTSVMLVAGLIALGIVLRATFAQVTQPPLTRTSAEQLRLSANAPPSLLLDELDRRLQETWTERIPNRRYARIEPVIDASRHSAPFAGELLEETQPMPVGGSTAPSIGAALSSARHRWIVALDLYGTLLTTIAVAIALTFVHGFEVNGDFVEQHFSMMGIAGILLLIALFCQHAAAELWGRFDFESVLLWVEFAGTYQTSSIGTGNALSSRINTQNQIVRIESMTLRVWRARIESVTFDKDAPRQVTAMFSTDKEAKELASHLAEFGQAQSALVAVHGGADRERLSGLGAAEQHLQQQVGGHRLVDSKSELRGLLQQAGSDPAQAGDTPVEVPIETPPRQVVPSPGASPDAGKAAPKYCHACGHALMPQARFCSHCGAPTAGTEAEGSAL